MAEPSRHIAEQAAAYFARCRSETAAQRQEREAWLAADERHRREYEEVQRVWDHAANLHDDVNLQAHLAEKLASVQRSHRLRSRLLLAAAVVVVALCGTYLGWLYLVPSTAVNYATALGERRTEVLADGTHVVLNTDSALQVQYTRSRREVELRRGEAQFEVTHDAERPFVVNTGEGTVTALGTRFQVRRDKDAATVTLLEGKVEVAHGEQRTVLRPNEQAHLSDAAGIRVSTIDPKQVNGWLDGWLFFRNTPLSQVVAEANRYSAKKLRLGDNRLAGLRFSGSFRTGSSTEIAKAAAQILPVRADEQGADIVFWPK
jgi:transmembrane sensor